MQFYSSILCRFHKHLHNLATTLGENHGVIFIIISILFWTCAENDQNGHIELDNLSFGEETMFDIVTWNIENFPKKEVTVSMVKKIMETINGDIYCLQEIKDKAEFINLLSGMSNYDYVMSNYSYIINLAIVYNNEFISIDNTEEIWHNSSYRFDGDEDYFNNARYYFASRPPLRVDIRWYNNQQSIDITIINIHLKCCGNGKIDSVDIDNDGAYDRENPEDEEYRRQVASYLLAQYIETNLSGKNVIVLGDLNDEIQETQSINVFWNFIEDSTDYRFIDMDIAYGSSSHWSYPSWPSHLDHILITNELFDEFEGVDSEVTTIHIEDFLDGSWSEYDKNISDHRPVAWKFKPSDG